MSTNFEVLERLQQDQELFRVPPVTKTSRNGRRGDGKVSLPDPDGFTREEILRLVHCLFLTANGNGHCPGSPRQVVFCGIDEADGSNLVCAQVARCLAEEVPSQVCIVDANLRSPSRRPLFEELDSDYDNTKKGRRRIADNLWFASSDSLIANGGAATLDQMRVMIRDLRDELEHVVINAPPVGLYSDAALLGQSADGVVLVLEANSTRRVAARKAKLALEASNVSVLGTVLNNRTFPIPERIYRLL
jgi:Mrp family chromosome partitioning ATPase